MSTDKTNSESKNYLEEYYALKLGGTSSVTLAEIIKNTEIIKTINNNRVDIDGESFSETSTIDIKGKVFSETSTTDIKDKVFSETSTTDNTNKNNFLDFAMKIGSLESGVGTLKTNISSLEDKASNFETNIVSSKQDITKLKNDVNNLEKEVKELKKFKKRYSKFKVIKEIIFTILLIIIMIIFILVHLDVFSKALSNIFDIVDLLNKKDNIQNNILRMIINLICLLSPLALIWAGLKELPNFFKELKEIIESWNE